MHILLTLTRTHFCVSASDFDKQLHSCRLFFLSLYAFWWGDASFWLTSISSPSLIQQITTHFPLGTMCEPSLLAEILRMCAFSPAFNFEGAKLFIGIFGGSYGQESAHNVGDPGLIPGSRWSPREGNGYPFQYSWLENSMDRGAWRTPIYGVTKSRSWLSNSHFHFWM